MEWEEKDREREREKCKMIVNWDLNRKCENEKETDSERGWGREKKREIEIARKK